MHKWRHYGNKPLPSYLKFPTFYWIHNKISYLYTSSGFKFSVSVGCGENLCLWGAGECNTGEVGVDDGGDCVLAFKLPLLLLRTLPWIKVAAASYTNINFDQQHCSDIFWYYFMVGTKSFLNEYFDLLDRKNEYDGLQK